MVRRWQDACLMRLLISVIGRPHQGTDCGMGETHLSGLRLEHAEDVGVHVSSYRKVA